MLQWVQCKLLLNPPLLTYYSSVEANRRTETEKRRTCSASPVGSDPDLIIEGYIRSKHISDISLTVVRKLLEKKGGRERSEGSASASYDIPIATVICNQLSIVKLSAVCVWSESEGSCRLRSIHNTCILYTYDRICQFI
jgi:hypothetical protein